MPCCGYRQYVFEKGNDDIVEELDDFMLAQPEDSVWVAHNGGRFDTVFLLRELLVKRKIVPQVIMNGNKIMCLEIETHNLKIIDSYLFLSMRLSKFPQALGIKDLTKGYHPYHFTDLNYVGPMIGLEYFDPPAEGSKECDKFDEWYNVQKTKTYVFREAIYYYCRLDVDILRQGCVIFARLIKEITGIFPFYDRTCHTIAGLALKIYRSNFLTNNVIGQIPPSGYGGNVNQSTIALCWLKDIERELEMEDKYLASKLSAEGEQRILGRRVDGYCAETCTIYQFHRCFYHGCEKCYDSDGYNNVSNEKFYTLREKTRRTTQLFEMNNYRVIEKWECDYMREKKLTYSRLIQLRHCDFFVYLNLNPRDALFSGRTSPAKLFHESLTQKTRYYDVTSLYPHVQKKYRYPISHPEIIRGIEKCADIEIANVFGLIIKCKVLAPTHLLFPILPVRTDKLTFPLGRTCVETQCDTCTHGDEERALYRTWTSVEVHKAIQHGYKILIIYEIYHYNNSRKIFDMYVDTFMKIKQESSGIPKHCLDDNGAIINEELEKYVREYAEHEEIHLNPASISYNPGRRTVMKALLNSLWGKLAQNEDTTIVSFVDSLDDLLSLVNDASIDVTSLDFISDNVARTTHRKTGSLTTLGNRNVVIASFVTAYAHLELFEVIHKLDSSVLYYDTDSVIFVEDIEKGHVIKTGEYLGQMTDELEEKNCSEKWIEQFCATGPKSYSYRTNEYTRTQDDGSIVKQRDEIVHVKGFTLKGDAKKKITFDSINLCIKDKKKESNVS